MPATVSFQYLASFFFAIAIFHTFTVGWINKQAHRFAPGSVAENFLHLFGEVELVFGMWAAIWISLSMLIINFDFVIKYLNGRDFTEAIFVFAIMSICSTKPILGFTEKILLGLSKLIPINPQLSAYFTILFVGPLIGSLITEPAAMTITGFLLLPRFFTQKHSLKFKYATIALLFINISLGGTLTPFAAPPVLMVAHKWNWDLTFMLTNFAPKTLVVLLINTTLISFLFRKEIEKTIQQKTQQSEFKIPFWIILIHLLFLLLTVLTSHYEVLFIGIFLFFVGFLRATREYQTPLKLREPLLVGFFLAGLIVLGGAQNWWLEPLLGKLSNTELFFGSISLTAITDNAALTYLGSLVPTLSDQAKLALVSGSVIGGGLTLIANAPNPAGYGILRNSFGEDGFSPVQLLFWAIPLMIIAAVVFLIM